MRHESILRRNDTLFLIIDVQQKLLPVVADSEEVLKYSTIIAQAAGILDIPLIISEQYPKGLGNTVESLLEAAPVSRIVLEKTTFSCMQNPELAKAITTSMASQVVICGIEAHICVCQTALDIAATGTQVHILSDAVSSRKIANKTNTLARLSRFGINVSNTESALFELLTEAGGEAFKTISKLIK